MKKKLIILATMKVEAENTKNRTSFWTLLHTMLSKVKLLPDNKFNPIGLVADKQHAN